MNPNKYFEFEYNGESYVVPREWIDEHDEQIRVGERERQCDKCDYFISVEEAYQQSRIDAIDEFVKECVKFEDLTFDEGHIHRIKMIAEQLKELQ